MLLYIGPNMEAYSDINALAELPAGNPSEEVKSIECD